jgi:hypothetical protein
MLTDLENSERDLLVELLTRELDELVPEIRRTDEWDYKHDLKDRKIVVQGLLERLRELQPA